MTTNITAYFGETMKSGSGIVATADYSGTTNVAGLYGPTGVGGFNSGQFQFVTIEAFSSSGSSSASLAGAVIVASTGQGGVKVLGNKPQLGDPCQLFDIGEVKVVCGAALAVGQVVMSDANGRAVPYVNNGSNVPVGEARIPTNASGDIGTIFMYPNMDEGDAPPMVFPALVTGAGSTTISYGHGPVLSYGLNSVTPTAANSYQLPPAFAGALVMVSNQSASYTASLWPGNATDVIDVSSVEVGVALAHTTAVMLFGVAAGVWVTLEGAIGTAT